MTATSTALRFTTSWDDGHPLDLRVAEILAAHGFEGTFYVPVRNSEGRPVVGARDLRELATGFEIGAHSIDHVRLHQVQPAEAVRQITESKHTLEDAIGRTIAGFCYPGGVHTPAIRAAVRAAGFQYARTVANLVIEAPVDPFQLPTTLQLYPHHRWTYLKNFARGRDWRARAWALPNLLGRGTFDEVLARILEQAHARGGVFHLWGHSWEIEAHQLWGHLDRFLRAASRLVGRGSRIPNAAVLAS